MEQYSVDGLTDTLDMSFRKVVADDYDAIIAISKDVYGGHDYLPYRYKMWCEDSHRELFGVFVDGRLVAFDSIFVIDGGKTVLAKALRVDEAYRGKGLTQYLARVIDEHVNKDLRDVRRVRIATAEGNHASIRVHEKLGFKHLLSLAVCALYAKEAAEFASQLRHLFAHNADKVVTVSAEELMGHWQALDQSQRERMAPSETFVHDWDPFEIQLDNLKYLQEHLGWERGCQLLAVLGAGTNELKGFAVTGMNRNMAGFEYYSNINTDDPATAARLMHAGWEEGSKEPHEPTAYVFFYNEGLRLKIESVWRSIKTLGDNKHFIVDHAPSMLVMEKYIR